MELCVQRLFFSHLFVLDSLMLRLPEFRSQCSVHAHFLNNLAFFKKIRTSFHRKCGSSDRIQGIISISPI